MTQEFSQPQLASIASAIADPALVVDLEGMVVSANGAAVQFFNGSPIGQHLTMSMRTPAILQAAKDAVTHGLINTVQHQLRAPVPRMFEVNVAPLGQVHALLCIRDLTHAENVERMRSDFVANASHELRTPLSSITGFIETLQGPAKNDPKARDEFLGIMKAQAGRMAVLIDDLLSLSKIELSEHVMPNETADLVPITHSAVDLLRPVAEESGCSVLLDLPKNMAVTGDSNQLSQVVHNLIENAIKYGGKGKEVSITGYNNGQMASLTVRDNGPGIAPEHVPRLTERFYRVNVQDSRMRGGTGLGLAIVKHILNRHRGRLEIKSELGKGSAFQIYVPLKI